MEYTTARKSTALVVSVTGRLDANTTTGFEQACSEWIAQGEKALVLDFTNLEYISSAGLRTILATAKRLKGNQGALALCCLQKMVAEVFIVSGFSAYLPILATVDEAITALSA